jgi:hypothetical protein
MSLNIGIYLYLAKELDKFNNYLNFLGITESKFFERLTKDELYIISQSLPQKKGKKEDDYHILSPENAQMVISYYPDMNVKVDRKSEWKVFGCGHANINKTVTEFKYDFDEFKYNNIEEFVKDWGFRIVYKTDIGKYLEENTSFTIRVTRDAQYQSALKSLSMFS